RAGALRDKLVRLQAALDAFLAKKPGPAELQSLGKALTGGFPPRLQALKDALSAKQITFQNLPKSLVEREVSADGRYRVYILPKADLRDNDALRAFVTQVLSVAPAATGGPVVELLSGDAVVGAFVESSLIAFAVIALMLLILLRSLRDMLMILVTVLLAGAFTLAIVVASGLSFNFANIIVVPLLLGLGVASAIHLVVRARREAGVILLNTSTPRAILFSALTTLASFGSLAVTNHQGTASMGIVLVIALSMTLLCSLIFLPAMIDLFRNSPLPTNPEGRGDEAESST
ncbi:MAG: MMPL family transporter, partial [Pseudomonadota bacterium]